MLKFKLITFYFILILAFGLSYAAINQDKFLQGFPVAEIETPIEEKFVKPETVRAIYLTASSAANESYREDLLNKIEDSKINSVIIDVKDYSGYILYDSQLEEVKNINAVRKQMPDVKKIIDEFHDKNIYVIARQTVFQDPVLAKGRPELALKTYAGGTWYDKSGLAWMDPQEKGVWEYNLSIAKEAANLGFDEINFDYMRYPSDGNISNIKYNLPPDKTKSEVMEEFFVYLSENLRAVVPTSIDTFGLVMDHTDDDYDLNIGQRLNNIIDHFDYVCPMMYPSHYPLNYLGFANSAEHPGAVISHGLEISYEDIKDKRAKIRPWLQAFHLRAHYYEDKIDAQTEAVESFDHTDGWLLWNARNYYPDYIFD